MHAETRVGLLLCALLFVTGILGWCLHDPPVDVRPIAPVWLPPAAATVAATALLLSLAGGRGRPRLLRIAMWTGLLLLLWTAGGLPLDLLRVASLIVPGLMPAGVDWAGLAVRLLAAGALVVLARLALARPSVHVRTDHASWYGYAAFALALPYPVLKTWWALGGVFGLRWPDADGLAGSPDLWLPALPWLLAAALSLLLVRTPRRMPRRLLLVAGWSATVVVATIGPVAFWSLIAGLIRGDADFGGMEGWVYGLVYGSWVFWALAAAAATRSYQLRTGREPPPSGQVGLSPAGRSRRSLRRLPWAGLRKGGGPGAAEDRSSTSRSRSA